MCLATKSDAWKTFIHQGSIHALQQYLTLEDFRKKSILGSPQGIRLKAFARGEHHLTAKMRSLIEFVFTAVFLVAPFNIVKVSAPSGIVARSRSSPFQNA